MLCPYPVVRSGSQGIPITSTAGLLHCYQWRSPVDIRLQSLGKCPHITQIIRLQVSDRTFRKSKKKIWMFSSLASQPIHIAYCAHLSAWKRVAAMYLFFFFSSHRPNCCFLWLLVIAMILPRWWRIVLLALSLWFFSVFVWIFFSFYIVVYSCEMICMLLSLIWWRIKRT